MGTSTFFEAADDPRDTLDVEIDDGVVLVLQNAGGNERPDCISIDRKQAVALIAYLSAFLNDRPV